jgi:drug/metabolite transporter (DMT)-like permease
MPNDNIRNYIHLHFIVFIWGFTAVIGALITLDALPLVWFRMLIAVGIILLFIAIKKIPVNVPKKVLLGFIISGLVIAVHWLTFFKAIKVSNVSITLACMSTGALFSSLLERLIYRAKMVWYEMLMGFIVVIALCIIIYGDLISDVYLQILESPSQTFSLLSGAPAKPGYYWGILLALCSAFLSALFAVINAGYAKKYNPVTVSFYELLGGVIFLSIYLLFTGSFTPDFFRVSASDWLWLFALGSFCTASVHVMKVLTPYTVMLTINMEPVYGIILAVIVFNDKEKMSGAFYIGAAIILITVILNGILKNYAKPETK